MVVAIIVASGRSERFGRDKLSLPLAGKPLWRWSVDAFLNHPEVDSVVLVGPDRGECGGISARVEGGATRQESVRAGLEAVPRTPDGAAPRSIGFQPEFRPTPNESTNRGQGELGLEARETHRLEEDATEPVLVLIHDAARPLIDPDTISRVIAAAQRTGASGAAVPVADTIREVSDEPKLLDRTYLRAMQTPQAGYLNDLLRAHREGPKDQTDDLALLEAIGIPYEIVEGNRRNFKVTTEEDYQMARVLTEQPTQTETRTGLGYDVHAFSTNPTRPLMLGGIHFEGESGLEGHSDADALLHAVVDALLGAASLGDIGTHFPPSDPQWKDMSSLVFLQHAGNLITAEGWRITHLDATVLAERPKIMGRREEICRSIAMALGIDPTRVSVKATTHERLGAIGRGEGIAAMAVATLSRSTRGD